MSVAREHFRLKLNRARRELDHAVNAIWRLGRNLLVCWTHHGQEIKLCFVPNYQIFSIGPEVPVSFAPGRWVDEDTFEDVMMEFQAYPRAITLDTAIGSEAGQIPTEQIDRVLRRYAVTHVDYRAVVLFDIVGFSRANPIEQVAQLNLLEYSINHANEKLHAMGMGLELARSTVGDGFYVWNRKGGLQADFEMFLALLLMLGDNFESRLKDEEGVAPEVRATFCIGSHYSYYQVEGMRPQGFEYIVGDVTIEAARLISACSGGQVLVGDFTRPASQDGSRVMDSPEFIIRALQYGLQKGVIKVVDRALTDMTVALTGGGMNDDGREIDRFIVVDKHGFEHRCFNLVVYPKGPSMDAECIGLQDTADVFDEKCRERYPLNDMTMDRLLLFKD